MNINPINTSSLGQPAPQISFGGQEARKAANTNSASASSISELAVNQPKQAEASREALEKATQAMNEFVAPINSAINFALDDETGVTVVKVIDVNTQDVIRQIPTEEMLAIAKAIDKVKGLLVQQKA